MSKFYSAKHLCSWTGLVPCNDQSAGRRKSASISRAGVFLKPLLVQCALASLRKTNFSHFRDFYQNIKRRRGHKKAIIALAHKMLAIIYTLLVKGEKFNPVLRTNTKYKSTDKKIKQLEKEAKALGYSIVKDPDLANTTSEVPQTNSLPSDDIVSVASDTVIVDTNTKIEKNSFDVKTKKVDNVVKEKTSASKVKNKARITKITYG